MPKMKFLNRIDRGIIMHLLCICIMTFVALFECGFISIKLDHTTSFIFINEYRSLVQSLKSSLIDIVMKHNVEIIFSRSRQVILSQEIIKDYNGDYPYWKLIDIMDKNCYEGIHLSNQNGIFTVYSLAFEIDDPIPFSKDDTWSTQITAHDKFKSKILFSGSSSLILYRITRIMFKDDLDLLIFKNSSLVVEFSDSFKISLFNNMTNLNLDSSIFSSSQMYYMKIMKGGESFYLEERIENINPNPFVHNRFCIINSELSYNLKDAMKSIKLALKDPSNVIMINNNLSIHLDELPEPNGLVTMTLISSNLFLKLFENVISKLFFHISVSDIIISIVYEKDQRLWINYKKGIFSSSIGKYFMDSFKIFNVEFYNDLKNHLARNSIRIEDQEKSHIFQYDIGRLKDINPDSYLIVPSIKRIILFKETFSYNTDLQRKNYSKGVKFILPESNLSELIEKWTLGNEGQASKAMEIIFDRSKHQIFVSFLNLENKMTIFLNLEYHKWNLLLIDNRFNGSILISLTIRSHEIPLNLWNLLSNDLFILIKRTDNDPITFPISFPSLDGTLATKIIIDTRKMDKESRINLIEMLLKQRLPIRIKRFRLKFNFQIEIDIIDSSKDIDKILKDIDKIKGFINQKFDTSRLKIISDTIRKEFDIAPKKSSKPFINLNDDITKNSKECEIISSSKDLSWNMAIKLLLLSPIKPSTLQIIERVGEYPFYGYIEIIYYKKNFDLKAHIEGIEDRNQIVRIGKTENYHNRDFSFAFIQYITNKLNDSGGYIKSFPSHIIVIFELLQVNEINGINGIIDIIIEKAQKLIDLNKIDSI